MKTIIEVLTEVAASLDTPMDFYNGLESFQNIEAEDVQYPCVFFFEPGTRSYTVSASKNLNKTHNLVLGFYELARVDFTQLQHDVIIYREEGFAEEFMEKILKYRDPSNNILYADSLEGVDMTNVINVLDENLSGVQLEMDLVINPQVKIC